MLYQYNNKAIGVVYNFLSYYAMRGRTNVRAVYVTTLTGYATVYYYIIVARMIQSQSHGKGTEQELISAARFLRCL